MKELLAAAARYIVMRTIGIALLAALLAIGCWPGIALAGGKHARPAQQPKYQTISGTVVSVKGDLVRFREDDGTTVTVDQTNLVIDGQPLTQGLHFAIHGHFRNRVFIAQVHRGGE